MVSLGGCVVVRRHYGEVNSCPVESFACSRSVISRRRTDARTDARTPYADTHTLGLIRRQWPCWSSSLCSGNGSVFCRLERHQTHPDPLQSIKRQLTKMRTMLRPNEGNHCLTALQNGSVSILRFVCRVIGSHLDFSNCLVSF